MIVHSQNSQNQPSVLFPTTKPFTRRSRIETPSESVLVDQVFRVWQDFSKFTMAKLRRDVPNIQFPGSSSRPLRVVASGTLFQTYTLSIPSYPAPSTVTRAHSVEKTRGGSASTVLSLLAQFPAVEAVLVASLGGNDEGTMVLQDLEAEGVVTRYCKVWKHSGVPTAWVMHSGALGRKELRRWTDSGSLQPRTTPGRL